MLYLCVGIDAYDGFGESLEAANTGYKDVLNTPVMKIGSVQDKNWIIRES